MTKDLQRFLVFELGAHRFGLPLDIVDEVVMAVLVSPLPGAPAIVEGVLNLRGETVPLLAIHERFNLPPRDPDRNDHFIVCRIKTRRVAVRADRALDLVEISSDQIDPGSVLGDESGLLTGIARTEDGLVIIHDLRAFLSAAQASALADALASVSLEGG